MEDELGHVPHQPSPSSVVVKKLCPYSRPLLEPRADRSEASTALRSCFCSAASFLQQQRSWARTQAVAEPSGGSGKSSSNLSGINISVGGALPTCGPTTRVFQQVLKLPEQNITPGSKAFLARFGVLQPQAMGTVIPQAEGSQLALGSLSGL